MADTDQEKLLRKSVREIQPQTLDGISGFRKSGPNIGLTKNQKDLSHF